MQTTEIAHRRTYEEAFPPHVLRVLAVLVAFVALRTVVYDLGALSESVYRSPVVMASLLTRADGTALIALALLGSYRLRPSRINEIEGLTAPRVVGLAALVALALPFSTYDFNAWYGQWHIADRAALVVLAIASFRTLAAVPLFVALLVVTVSQFEHPLGSYSWTDKRAIVDLLIVLVVGLAILRPDRSATRAIWTAWTIVLGSWYIQAALGKLELGWIGSNELHNLFVSATGTYGWLGLDDGQILAIAGRLGAWNGALCLGAFLIEAGSWQPWSTGRSVWRSRSHASPYTSASSWYRASSSGSGSSCKVR